MNTQNTKDKIGGGFGVSLEGPQEWPPKMHKVAIVDKDTHNEFEVILRKLQEDYKANGQSGT